MPIWTINKIEVLNAEENPNPAGWVLNLHWSCTEDGGRAYGSVSMPAMEEGGKFTDLAAMTVEDRVAKALEWVAESIGAEQVTEIEANVAAKAAAILNPRSSSLEVA